jgi:hypothetical protein
MIGRATAVDTDEPSDEVVPESEVPVPPAASDIVSNTILFKVSL